MKYNVSVTFCSVLFFVHTPVAKTCERIYTLDGSKRVKSGKDVHFGAYELSIGTKLGDLG